MHDVWPATTSNCNKITTIKMVATYITDFIRFYILNKQITQVIKFFWLRI